jgi:ClpP class serine protease
MSNCRIIFLALLLPVVGSAWGQQAVQPAARPLAAQPTPELSPQAQAQRDQQDQEMTRAAGQVIDLVDRQQAGEVWEGASAVAKKLVDKESFVRQIAEDRRQLGAVVSRKRIAVTRAAYPAGGAAPQGDYVSVVISTKFANQPQQVRELISFHLDADDIWRVTGYSVR